MPYFVEFLRAKRALIVVAVILGLVLLSAVVLRLATLSSPTFESRAYELQNSPTAHVTSQVLADGTHRTIVDDPAKRRHAVIDRNGSSFHMTVTEPSDTISGHDRVALGSVHVKETDVNGMAHVVVSYNISIPLTVLLLMTLPFGLLVATILAGPLAKENDGHLELAWTKPTSRVQYALLAVATDVAAIWIAQIVALAVFLLCIVIFVMPRFLFGDSLPATFGLAALGTVAWYAMLTGASSSLKRGLGLIVGLGWPIAIIVPAVAGATSHSDNVVLQTLHVIFTPLAYIDPLHYLMFNSHGAHDVGPLGPIAYSILALAVLAIIYIAAAVLQWRRVEA